MKKKIIFLVAAALMLNSCDDLFEPACLLYTSDAADE